MLLASWYTIFWLFSILDKLGDALIGLLFICGIGALLFGIIGALSYGNERWDIRSKLFTLAFAFTLVFQALLPSKKDMLLIIAGGAAGEFVAHNKDAQALPAEATKWLRAEIQSATAELNPAVQAKKKELEGLSQEELVNRLLAAKDSIH